MINVKILGIGCPKCKKLEEKVRTIVDTNTIDATIEKITDVNDMMKYNIMMTPGLVISEKLVSSGNIPKDAEILSWLLEENVSRT